jgi:hypothetical protein
MTTKKEMPDDWWNHDINPILGYKYERKPLSGGRQRDKWEYPEEENYNPNEE